MQSEVEREKEESVSILLYVVILRDTSVVDSTVSSSRLRTASVTMVSYGRKRLLITCREGITEHRGLKLHQQDSPLQTASTYDYLVAWNILKV